jgi:hypothetical protein
MGNKDAGRQVAALPNAAYMGIMGASVTNQNIKNSGIAFTNHEVFKYFKVLRDYALNRLKWHSDSIPEYELRLIEWNIFHYGKCAMLRPKIIKSGIKFQTNDPKIYQCAFTDINHRTGKPIKISLVNPEVRNVIIDINYNDDEFVIFTDEFLFAQDVNPFVYVAWEFACKLHELDLAFNANSHRNRMPFVFNNGASEIEKDGTFNVIANKGVSIAEIMRSAYGRNEQFVEIPQSMVGTTGFMHEPRYIKNDLLDHIQAQKQLYQAYFELLGLYTNKEKSGVYTIKDLQKNGDESPDYITQVLKNTRIMCAKLACEMFNINMSLEVI